MRLIDFFDKGVELAPDRPYLVDDAEARSYRQVQAVSHRIANAFRRDGIGPGLRAAVYSHNATRAFECVIGILRAGCVWVPVNVRNSVDDTVYVLTNTEAEVLFYSVAHRDSVRRILDACPSLRRAICIDAADPPYPSLDTLIDGEAETSPELPGGRDDVVTLFSSGGTTGAPKGVMMTNLAWATMVAAVRSLNYHPAPVHLVAAPMTHAAGGSALVMAAMGATNVMLPAFDPLRVMQAIERHRVTHLFLPPTAIYRLLAHPDLRNHDYSSLRFFNYASAPMAPEKIKEAMAVFGPVMMNSFGQTETGLNVTYFSPEEHAQVLASGDDRRLLSCGRASPFTRVEIMDDDGVLLPPGATGEIVVRGNQVMKGYWRNPEETAKASAFGWHHTGDVGFKDAEGWLFLVDRKRDLIISGGFNVFPSEVEKVVVSHPAVQDCAVVGCPDDEWGEVVTAVVEAKPGAAVDFSELTTFCRERLGGVKTPKAFELWPELPRSPVGKVLRRKVREHFWRSRSRAI